MVEDHVASPTYAPLLADRTAELSNEDCTGVFHIGGGEAHLVDGYARLIFELAGLNPELKPTNEREYRTAARRPKFSALSNSKMESAGITPMPRLREALTKYSALRPR